MLIAGNRLNTQAEQAHNVSIHLHNIQIKSTGLYLVIMINFLRFQDDQQQHDAAHEDVRSLRVEMDDAG